MCKPLQLLLPLALALDLPHPQTQHAAARVYGHKGYGEAAQASYVGVTRHRCRTSAKLGAGAGQTRGLLNPRKFSTVVA